MAASAAVHDIDPGDTGHRLVGLSRVAAPMMERAMKRATGKDLSRLKELLERG